MCFSVNEMCVFWKMQYRIFKEMITDENGEIRLAYGIKLIQAGETKCRISDVTCSYPEIRKLCSLCNRHKLSPMHLEDIIEDFLCDLT